MAIQLVGELVSLQCFGDAVFQFEHSALGKVSEPFIVLEGRHIANGSFACFESFHHAIVENEPTIICLNGGKQGADSDDW